MTFFFLAFYHLPGHLEQVSCVHNLLTRRASINELVLAQIISKQDMQQAKKQPALGEGFSKSISK